MPGENPNDNQQQQSQQQQSPTGIQQNQQQSQQPGGQNNDALASAIAQLTAALGQPKEAEVAQEPGKGISGTGDAVLDGLVESVAIAYPKLDLDRAVGKAIETGDATRIDTAYLREVAGKDFDRVLRIAQSAVSRVNESAAQLKTSVYDAVGGEANWLTAVEAFNKGAPADLKSAVALMLDSGKGPQVKAAAQLVAQYATAGGFLRTSESGGAKYAAPTGGQGLSKADFQAELAKLDRSSRDFREQREQLFNRRSLGQKAGL